MQKKTNFNSQKLNDSKLDSPSTIQPLNNSTTQLLNPSTFDGVAIKVDHVSKKYCKSLKRSMLYGVKDIARNTLGLSSHSDNLRKSEFWAVNDVSFELKKGEILGIIGPNGAGKTTLLKMLNGIFWPDKGKITVKGKVSALIEVGAGFHPLLTGRENVYIKAAILGMTKEEVDEKFDDIVAFANIGDFIDAPVKFYSSGMFVRLGFAVAVHCEPDILLVDEVLAVGDTVFKQKAKRKMIDLLHSGISVIFVSHNIGTVESLTSRCIYLNNGKVVATGPSEEVATHYLQDSLRESIKGKQNQIEYLMASASFKNPEYFILGDVVGTNSENIATNEFYMFDDVDLTFHCNFPTKSRDVVSFSVGIFSRDSLKIAHTRASIALKEPHGFYNLRCVFKTLPLREGVYNVGFYVAEKKGATLFKSDVVFRLVVLPEMGRIKQSGSSSGLVAVHSDWTLVEQKEEWM